MTSTDAGLPATGHGDPTRLDLVSTMRRLTLAVGTTGADRDELEAAAAALSAWADRLERDQVPVVPAPSYDEAVGAPSYHAAQNNPALPPVPMTFVDGEARAVLALNEIYQGPRGSAHGGVVACVMDTLLASLVQHHGMLCVTASLTVDYRARTPLHQPLDLHAWLVRTEGRKVFVKGTIRADGRVTAEATGVFVTVADR